MSKDPAFLFYFRDFLVSTDFLTAEEVGCYIRILCHMADKGRLPIEHMQSICKAYGFTKSLQDRFKQDEKGLFYNERLEKEVYKRKIYTESRRKNALNHPKAYAKHMGNGNDNIKEGIIKGGKIPTLGEVTTYCNERKNKVDPQKFVDFYTAKGWMIGKNKVKDWKACIRTWERNNTETQKTSERRIIA